MSVATQTQAETGTPTAAASENQPMLADEPDESEDEQERLFALTRMKHAVEDKLEAAYKEGDHVTNHSEMNQIGGGAIDRIIGAGVTVAIGAVILNFVLTMDIVSNSTGPLGDFLTGTLPDTLVAALTFAVLGLIALAGGMALRMLRGGF